MLKEMSRSPTIQKSRTGDSAPEEEMPKSPPDENGHTPNSLPKGAGKSAGHWQPSLVLKSVHIAYNLCCSCLVGHSIFND